MQNPSSKPTGSMSLPIIMTTLMPIEPFMIRALLAGILLGPLCAFLGVFATARRIARELNDLRSQGLIIFDIQKIRDFIC